MTIGCLDKYRRLGVGTTLLNYILETAKADGCVKATLHVQVKLNFHYCSIESSIRIANHNGWYEAYRIIYIYLDFKSTGDWVLWEKWICHLGYN